MKKSIKIGILVIALSFGAFGLQSFTSTENTTEVKAKSQVEFKVVNDSGSEFNYCVNGGHNSISKGTTKGFSHPDGQELKYIDGSNCGKFWLKVTSAMNGKTYKLSELTK